MEDNEFTREWGEGSWRMANESQAEIHIQALAEAMWDAQSASTPLELNAGEWHIPYDPGEKYELNDRLAVAVARAARVSYTVVGQDKDWSVEQDVDLHNRLINSGHMSPLEHAAKAMSFKDYDNYLVVEDGKTIPGVCRNFKGCIKYRNLKEENQF